jgi:hypothetical protein
MMWIATVFGAVGVLIGFLLGRVFRTTPNHPRGDMNPETSKHLDQIETAVRVARGVFAKFPHIDTLRNIIVIGLIDQMIEHHESMLMLIRAGKIGSAFALSRSIFESMFRGLWFALCATEDQLKYFEDNDELPFDTSGKRMNMTTIATAIDTATGADPTDPSDQFFKGLKDRGWKALCSYTHSGLLQLGRRFVGHSVQPGAGYSDEEIVEITTSSTTCVLILIDRFLASEADDEGSKSVMGLISTHGPLVALSK